eukprot:SAG31_NODE_697_length_12745_cov_67.888502_13_plen_37_part_00
MAPMDGLEINTILHLILNARQMITSGLAEPQPQPQP